MKSVVFANELFGNRVSIELMTRREVEMLQSAFEANVDSDVYRLASTALDALDERDRHRETLSAGTAKHCRDVRRENHRLRKVEVDANILADALSEYLKHTGNSDAARRQAVVAALGGFRRSQAASRTDGSRSTND